MLEGGLRPGRAERTGARLPDVRVLPPLETGQGDAMTGSEALGWRSTRRVPHHTVASSLNCREAMPWRLHLPPQGFAG